MAGTNINRVILTGNLTRDPELRSLPSGMSVCSLRLAVNDRRKNGQTGQWEEVPNYFNVTVFGAQGENVQRYLAKGRAVAVDGRLRWREYTDRENNKREAIEVVADSVQFLGGQGEGGGGGGARGGGGYGAQQGDYGGQGGYGGGQQGGGQGGYGGQGGQGGYGQQGGYGGDMDAGDFSPPPAGGGQGAPAEDDIPF